MGLDLPWVADGLFRDSPAVREATDALLRRVNCKRPDWRFKPFTATARPGSQQALRAIGRLLAGLLESPGAPGPEWETEGRVAWNCECSDAATPFTALRKHPPVFPP
jgi:HTH-type transcriptional regulator, transcriptional repressor of NAD biosynthesis genes